MTTFYGENGLGYYFKCQVFGLGYTQLLSDQKAPAFCNLSLKVCEIKKIFISERKTLNICQNIDAVYILKLILPYCQITEGRHSLLVKEYI